MSRFNILHLSDLHFQRKALYQRLQIWAELRNTVCDRLRQLAPDRIDVVAVTGDVVDQADVALYEPVAIELLRLIDQMAETSGHAPKIATIPGNHDLLRHTVKKHNQFSDLLSDAPPRGWAEALNAWCSDAELFNEEMKRRFIDPQESKAILSVIQANWQARLSEEAMEPW